MNLPLPPALYGERRQIDDSAAGRLAFYCAAPPASPGRPLLLVHSINAAASAAEVRPLYEHYRRQRPVYAPDLPGYGHSERSDRRYTPRLMTDALHALCAQIARDHGAGRIDALAVSLSCEYLARAAVEAPAAFCSLALVSPTGFSGKTLRTGAPGSTREVAWLRRALRSRCANPRLFRWLTRPGVIRYFLRRTWGARQIDEALWAYCVLTTQQPGAQHAPFDFLSATLFSNDINRLYDQLTLPVWMSHGMRGDFVDYRLKRTVQDRPNWRISAMPTGALPYFERPVDFCADYDAFLADITASSTAVC